ncbi:MAG: DUF882 domain-containing protein [Azospirillaceae bacterium]
MKGGLASRRRVLAGLACLPAISLHPSHAQEGGGGAPRSLKLYNLHTGERFDGEYHDGRRYLLDALAALDWFLRDHHADEAAIMDIDVLDLVWRMDRRYLIARGHQPTINVHSAYRTEATNQALISEGAAVNSYHVRARAIDISVQGYGIHILANFARAVQVQGGLGIYWRGRFVHLDTGPQRFWYSR